MGIGAQFGGKYFCHDVRVIRLPRHGASLPGRHRRLLLGRPPDLGKITADGVFLEQLEHNPAKYLPEVDRGRARRRGRQIDLNRPMDEIRASCRATRSRRGCRSPAR
jgi:fumarate hydratase, class I